jgi:hypothetical protein
MRFQHWALGTLNLALKWHFWDGQVMTYEAMIGCYVYRYLVSEYRHFFYQIINIRDRSSVHFALWNGVG